MTKQPALVEPEHVAETRLRSARHGDIAAIAPLISRAYGADGIPYIDERDLEAVADQSQLIVLQLQPDEVVAAACVAIGRGLVFLVIDPEVASPQLEHRIIGVADALCESERGLVRGR